MACSLSCVIIKLHFILKIGVSPLSNSSQRGARHERPQVVDTCQGRHYQDGNPAKFSGWSYFVPTWLLWVLAGPCSLHFPVFCDWPAAALTLFSSSCGKDGDLSWIQDSHGLSEFDVHKSHLRGFFKCGSPCQSLVTRPGMWYKYTHLQQAPQMMRK